MGVYVLCVICSLETPHIIDEVCCVCFCILFIFLILSHLRTDNYIQTGV